MNDDDAIDAEWNTGQDDPHDHYPWKWTAYLSEDGGPRLGGISTPNGPRPDGTAHTFWSVVGNAWEPEGRLICAVVNRWAHDRYGTPLSEEDSAFPTLSLTAHQPIWDDTPGGSRPLSALWEAEVTGYVRPGEP